MDSFTLTSASGVKIVLSKGPVKQIALRSVQLNWENGIRPANFLFAKGPRVRVSVHGVSVTLSSNHHHHHHHPVSHPDSHPVSHSSTLHQQPLPQQQSKQNNSESSSSSSTLLYLLNLLILDVGDIQIVDGGDNHALLSLSRVTLDCAAKEQNISLYQVNLMLDRDEKRQLLTLDRLQLTHKGALARRATSASSFLVSSHSTNAQERLILDIGTVQSFIGSSTQQRLHEFLGKFKKRQTKQKNDDGSESGGKQKNGIDDIFKAMNIHNGEFHAAIESIDISAESSEGVSVRIAVDSASGVATVCRQESSTTPPPTPAVTSTYTNSNQQQCNSIQCTASASWKKLDCSLCPSMDNFASPSIQLQCSSSEVSLSATPRNYDHRSSDNENENDTDGMAVAGMVSIHINAMHTKIKHWDLPDVYQCCTNALNALKKESKEIQMTTTMLSSSDNEEKKRSRSKMAVLSKFSISLGQGSSLQFLDVDSECMWLSSLHSANLVFDRSSHPDKSLRTSFEATQIAMTTAKIGPHVGSTADIDTDMNKFELEKVLSAKSVQLEWKSGHGKDLIDVIDISTQEVHMVLHPASAGALADVSRAVVCVIKKSKSDLKKGPSNSETTTRKRPHEHAAPLPSIRFCIQDTLFVAPATVTVPAIHSSTGRVQLVHSTLGASFETIKDDVSVFKSYTKTTIFSLEKGVFERNMSPCQRLKLNGLNAVVDADAIGCALQAADDILAMYQLLKASARHNSSWSRLRNPQSPEKETAAVVVDDDGPGYEPQDEGKNMNRKSLSFTTTTRSFTSTPLHIDATSTKLSFPLSADLEISVEVDSTHAEVASRPGLHLVNTDGAVLTMKGKRVMQWSKAAATVRTIPKKALNEGVKEEGEGIDRAQRPDQLTILPLPLIQHQTSRKYSKDDEEVEEEASLLPGLAPYRRAQLQPWIDYMLSSSNELSTGKRNSYEEEESVLSSQSPDSYLGQGPKSIADIHIQGFQLIVPYDREPGPTQRYAEMYFKALSSAFNQSISMLKKKSATALNRLKTGSTDSFNAANDVHPHDANSPMSSGLFPMQLMLHCDDFAFKFEHHPMEQWFAVHGPLLRQAAVQSHLWEEAANTVHYTDTVASPLHAGLVESSIMHPFGNINKSSNNMNVNNAHGTASVLSGPGSVKSAGGGSAEDSGTKKFSADTVSGDAHPFVISGGVSEAGQREHAGPLSDGASSISGSAGANLAAVVDPDKEHAWEGLARTLASQYIETLKSKVVEAECAQTRRDGQPCQDLLLIRADSIHALAVICGGTHGQKAALEFISSVDPVSAGVELGGLTKIHADVTVRNFAFFVGSAPQPFISSDFVVVSGPLGIAKQRTAPPTTSTRTLAVGAHRAVTIQTNVRGCKAPFKVYTDVSVDATKLRVVFTPGYEPSLAIMGMAGKRLAPSDPDKTAPRPPPVPWWDDLRYLWRGKAALHVSSLHVVLAAHHMPTVDETSPRMVIEAQTVHAVLDPGDYMLDMKGLGCNLYRATTNMNSPGGSLLALPFVHVPTARVKASLDWKLPNGRSPLHHHIFPALVQDGNVTQTPIVLANEYKAIGLDVSLDVFFGEGSSSTRRGGVKKEPRWSDRDDQGVDAMVSLPESTTPLGFLGDHQVAFMREFVSNFKNTPPYIKACAKRGTFFARKPRGGPPKRGIPRLLNLFRVHVAASPIDIAHFTADPSEPSAGICVGATSALFDASWLLNQPAPSFLSLPPHIKTSAAKSPPMRTITQDFALKFKDIVVHKDSMHSVEMEEKCDGDDDGVIRNVGTNNAHDVSSIEITDRRIFSQFDKTAAEDRPFSSIHTGNEVEQEGKKEEEEMELLQQDAQFASSLLQTLIGKERASVVSDTNKVITASSLSVTRQPLDNHGDVGVDNPGSNGGENDEDPYADPLSAALGQRQSRPLRVVVSNCLLLMDLNTRDAVWGAVSHMIAAFASKRKNAAVAQKGGGGRSTGMSPVPFSSQGKGTHGMGPSSSRVVSPVPSWKPNLNTTNTSADLPQRRQSSSMSQEHSGESNELLALLLQQKQEAGNINTPQASVGDEITGAGQYDDDDWGEGGGGGRGGGSEPYDPVLEDALEQDSLGGGDAPMTTPLDDVHSILKYEVQVNNFQVMMLTATEAGPGPGRLLLAAKSGRLRGLSLPEGLAPLQITTLGLQDVQAYVALTDIDPHVSLMWLNVTKSGFEVPSEEGPSALRRVFNPISIDLRHTKAPISARTTRRGGPGGPLSRAVSLRSPTPGGGTMIKSDELVLKIPEIAAVMNGREFEVVAEVVSLLLTPGPRVETINAEEKLLDEAENEEVEDTRQLYSLVRQQLNGWRRHALDVQRCIGLTVHRQKAGRTAQLHSFSASSTAPITASSQQQTSLQGDENANTNDVATLPVLTAMREYLAGEALSAALISSSKPGQASASYPGSPSPQTVHGDHEWTPHMGGSSTEMHRHQQQVLLLRWVEEQEAMALATYTHTKTTLLSLKADAGKQLQLRSASRVLLQLNRIVWQLCTAQQKNPFVQASLRGITFDRHRNRDHSGSAKFVIHRLEIIDATGKLPQGPATPPGVILTCWNPDSSYAREPVLRVVTTLGVPTKNYIVYDHLDATLHPLSLHLTESIAVACWEYFFPKEDSKSRQDVFAQSFGSAALVGGGASRGLGGVSGRRASLAAQQQQQQQSVDHYQTNTAVYGGDNSPAQGTSPMAATASNHHASRALMSGSDMPGTPSRGGGNSLIPTALFAEAEQGTSGASTPSSAMAASGRSNRMFKPVNQKVASTSHTSLPADSKKNARLNRFVYVKLNRAHMKITYQGYPIGIKDRILVINSYTCENLDGRWRDLLANVKQKAILSALWSGLGLQGRKIRELMDGAAPASFNVGLHHSHSNRTTGQVHGSDDGRSGGGSAKSIFAKMGLTRREASGGVEQTEMSEDVRTFHKKRALFGAHMMRNMMPSFSSGSSREGGARRGGGGENADSAQQYEVNPHDGPSSSTISSPQKSPASKFDTLETAQRDVVGLRRESAQQEEDFSVDTVMDTTIGVSEYDNSNDNNSNNNNSITPKTTVNTGVVDVSTSMAPIPVPLLDLQSPLPPDETEDDNPSHHNPQHHHLKARTTMGSANTTPRTMSAASTDAPSYGAVGGSMSPLQSGAQSFSMQISGQRNYATSPSRGESSPNRRLSPFGSLSPTKKLQAAIEPMAALFGQAFQQQSNLQLPRREDDDSNAAELLLGKPSPRKQPSQQQQVQQQQGGWVAKMANKALGGGGSSNNQL